MTDVKTASDILGALVLSGIMGMTGQGARTIVGLKKLSDFSSEAPGQSDEFQASRIVVGLMIGFVAGVIAGLSLNVLNAGTIDAHVLLGLAAAGYAGTDFIEGFAATIGSRAAPKWIDPTTTSMGALPPSPSPSPSAVAAVQSLRSAGRLFGLDRELKEATQYQNFIEQSATKHSLSLELVHGIGSRESAWGLTLRPKGPGGTGDWAPRGGKMPPDGLGWGRGLMQADYAASEFAKTGDWRDPAANIEFGCNELGDNIVFYTKAALPGVDPLRAGIAAYNCGRGNVHRAIDEGKDVDYYTTGRDYSADVLKRAAWFKDHISPQVS